MLRIVRPELVSGCKDWYEHAPVGHENFFGEENNPISPDPVIRAVAVDKIKRSIDEAKLIGAKILIGGIYQAHKVCNS